MLALINRIKKIHNNTKIAKNIDSGKKKINSKILKE